MEIRTWTRSYRGMLYIHVTQAGERRMPHLPHGAVIGRVDLVDMVRGRDLTGADLAWREDDDADLWYWLLRNPVRFAEPVRTRGYQSMWWPDAELEARLRAAQPL